MNNLPVAGRRVPPIASYSINPSVPSVGSRFGEWLILESGFFRKMSGRLRAACRVRCTCGNEAILDARTLIGGHSKRCKRCAWAATHVKKRIYQATANPLIPVGATFGRWTVIKNGFYIKKVRAVRAICQCGTEKDKLAHQLRNGHSKSCGCAGKEREIETVWKALHRNYQLGSQRRGLEFHLTVPQLKAFAVMPCAYCGQEPSNVYRGKYFSVRYSGLDRVDSSIGYVAGNVVPSCADCNFAKNKLTLEDFLALIARIAKHRPTVEGVHRLASNLLVCS